MNCVARLLFILHSAENTSAYCHFFWARRCAWVQGNVSTKPSCQTCCLRKSVINIF
jgi:hypothetical protein